MSLSAKILWHLAAPSSPWLLPFSLDELRPFPGVLCSWKLPTRKGIKSWLMLAHIFAEKMAVGFGWQIYRTSNVTVCLMASGSYTQPIPKNHLASCERLRSHDTPVDADTSTDNFT